MIKPFTTRVTTVDGFDQWLRSVNPGSVAHYFYGLLMEARSPEATKLRERVWKAYEDGVVLLFQERVNSDGCNYLAVLRKPPHRPIRKKEKHVPEYHVVRRNRYERKLNAVADSTGVARGNFPVLQALVRELGLDQVQSHASDAISLASPTTPQSSTARSGGSPTPGNPD